MNFFTPKEKAGARKAEPKVKAETKAKPEAKAKHEVKAEAKAKTEPKVKKTAPINKGAKTNSAGKIELAPHYNVILSPVITEKATNGSQYNQVTFRVHRQSTKPQIRTAIEALFNVKVTAVNTHNRIGKTKLVRGRKGFRQDVKFAIVTLKEGNTIDVTTGL
jgi:large subunit ribosomal protein L23